MGMKRTNGSEPCKKSRIETLDCSIRFFREAIELMYRGPNKTTVVVKNDCNDLCFSILMIVVNY